jgi:chemosensory pili system protein ChpA (sensor histidine kinase/response regulator)
MTNVQDFGALNWVKDELDVSIRQARLDLESYVESPERSSALQSCGDHLHQIARVLQMVQVYGPSMLAEEMELVVRAMVEGGVRQQEDAAEALMLALIQLPDYLEKLQGGDADIPLIILPLLNDLRAVRDAPLLSEAALFKPEIESGMAAGCITGQPNEKLPMLARKVRLKLHLGLLSWYRQRDTEQGWPLLRKVFRTIHQNAGTEQVYRLFWVAESLMHGLMEGTIAPGIAVKQLFSRIDRKLKMIIDGGEESIMEEQSSALLKNLLYYIARANSSDKVILQVKEAYNLDQVMPSEDQLTQGRQGLSGSNAELAESIRDAVGIELTRIKDILDLFMRDEKADLEMLSHLESPMRKLADTLGMIGQGALRSRLNRQASNVHALVEKGSMPKEFELMEMAGDILYVESSLSTLHTAHVKAGQETEEEGWGLNLPEGEYENLIKQTVREAKVDIAKAKEVIIGYTEVSDDATVLLSVQEGFKRVEGALRILNLIEAAEIMAKTGGYIQQLIDKNATPQRHQLNYLADVISAIEYYLETLVDGAGDRHEILSIAKASLNGLLSEGGEVTEYPEPVEVIDLASSAERIEGFEFEEEVVSDPELSESHLQLEEPALPEVEEEVLPSAELEPTPIPVEATPPVQEQEKEESAASVDKPALEEIDPEILEIFLEEAREELASIQVNFPAWRQNQSDEESLTTFRRSFHTLKGSGRLVGAKTIGELAWSVENMLNRVIEETIKVGPEMLDLLDRVIQSLPHLIDCQENGLLPQVDVARLEQEAYALADGKPLSPAEPVAEVAQAVASPESLELDMEVIELEAKPEALEPEAEALEPEAEALEPEAEALEPEVEVLEPEAEALEPEGEALEPEAEALEPESEALEPEAEALEPESEALEPESELEAVESPEGGSVAPEETSKVIEFPSEISLELDSDLSEISVSDEERGEAQDESESLLELDLSQDFENISLPHEVEDKGASSLELESFDLTSTISEFEKPATGKSEEEPSELDEVVGEAENLPEDFRDSDLEVEIEIDTELLSIFAEESESHIQEIENFLDMATGCEPPMPVPEEVVRACHTLRGSANMAGITPVAKLAESMEIYARALYEQERRADGEVIDLLSSCVDCIRQLLDWMPEETLPEPPFESNMIRLQEALRELGMPKLQAQEAVAPIIELPEPEPEIGITSDEMEQEITLELPSETLFEVSQPRDQEAFSESIELDQSPVGSDEAELEEPSIEMREEASFELGEDEELIEIFVEESRELLEKLEQGYPKWSASPDDSSVRDDFKRCLHTLKGSSRLAGIMPVGDLSHALEDLFSCLERSDLQADDGVKQLVRQVLDHLMAQTEEAASGGPVTSSLRWLQAIEAAKAESVTQESQEAPIDAKFQQELEQINETDSYDQALEADETSSYYEEPLSFLHDEDLFEHEGDPELTEIFVEESRELLSALEESYNDWRDKPAEHKLLDEMQRALHTLKGSSRLAGIEPVGDLSHAVESLLAAVVSGNLKVDESVLHVTREALDLLATQADAAEAAKGIPQSNLLLKHIDTLIQAQEVPLGEESIDPNIREALELESREESPAADAADSAEPETSALGGEDTVDELQGEALFEQDASEPDDDEEAEESFILLEEEVLLDVGEDQELVQIFVEEAKEFVETIESCFQKWVDLPQDLSLIEGIQRNLHTLKGSARLAGIIPVGDLSHAVESLMTALAEREIDPIPLVIEAARQSIDYLARQVEMISTTNKVPAADELVDGLHALLGGELETSMKGLVETIQERLDSDSQMVAEATKPDTESEGEQTPQKTADVIPFDRGLEELLSDKKPEGKEGVKRNKEQVRVNSDLMDRLVNHAGEVSIYRARLEQQNSVLGFNLAELEQTVSRLYLQLRNLEIETEAQILYRWERETEDDREKAEFDPLEMDRFSTIQQLSRALAETVNDLSNINESLADLQRETDTLLLQQSRISTDLQDGLLRTRMVPFAQLVPRLQRLVRQTSGQLGKRANLECFGIEGELDRGILNRMIPVLEHLLRNSVSHGIEAPALREQAGKQADGRISLYLDREANDVLITLSDDGKGLDIGAIRKRAIDLGMIEPNAVVSDDDLIQCVLLPGFSTAKEVTQISGRGVGLDVVTSEVKQLGGSLEIDSQPGHGTIFIIRLPLTLAITEALLVRVGEEIFAIPHGSVEGAVRIRRNDLMECYAGKQSGYHYAGKTYAVSYLGRMMGIGQQEVPDAARWVPLLLLQAGEHQVGLQVDELLGTRQVVVKSLGKQVGSVRWITGGTILADGRVALILDLASLVRMDATHTATGTAVVGEEVSADELKRAEDRLRVMVVDDSITVRKVTSRLLERNDMEVVTAKDGVEAVAMLQEQVPDIMLLDIEMPRMDGFELARHVNNSVDYYGLPIIMISSRVGDKHRQRAMDLGVKMCLGKPYQESELLDSINEVLAENRR